MTAEPGPRSRRDGASAPSASPRSYDHVGATDAPSDSPPAYELAFTDAAPRTGLPKRHRRPRLGDFNYLGQHTYHLVVVTRAREPLLVGHVASDVASCLHAAAAQTGFALLAYVVMPDHLHVVAAGLTDDSSAIRFMQRFKQRSAYAYRRGARTPLWQQSFFDRVLRRSEDVEQVARYIFENPLRAGLIAESMRRGGTLLSDIE